MRFRDDRVVVAALSQRPATGEVIGMGISTPLLTNLATRPEALPFDLDSFEYLATIARVQVALVASNDAPFVDLESMIAHSKQNGLPIAVGSPAQKSVLEFLASKSGADFRYLATDGDAETLKLILGGQVQAGFATGGHIQYLESGDMKMLLSLNNARHSYAPNTETVVEAGYDVFVDPIYFLAAAKGLSEEARTKLVEVFAAAIETDSVKEIVLNTTQGEAVNLGSESFRSILDVGLSSVNTLLGK